MTPPLPRAGPIALYDPSRGGHHEVMLPTMTEVLLARGHDVICFSPAEGPAARLAAAHEGRVRLCETTMTARPNLADSLAEAVALGASCFWHLDAGIELRRAKQPERAPLEVLCVLHRAVRLSYSALMSPGSLSEIWRIRRRRRAVQRLGKQGRVVVHSADAARSVAGLLPAVSVIRVPVRVPSGGPPSVRSGGERRSREGALLWVGALRTDKGAERLPGALARLARPVRLEVVGMRRGIAGLAEQLRRQDAKVWDQAVDLLDWNEMEAAYRRADLVLAPYPRTRDAKCTSGTVHLEALARGKPVVVGPGLARELPPEGLGTVMMRGDDDEALARAVEEAYARLEALTEEARRAAEWVEREHGYARYCTEFALVTRSLDVAGRTKLQTWLDGQ